MRRALFLTTAFLLFNSFLSGQADSVVCNETFKISEGVYTSYYDFRKQIAIKKEQIDSPYDKTHLDFFSKTMKEAKLNFSGASGKISLDTRNIWGFYQNGYLYVNYAGEFYRVPTFGSISYLLAMVEVINPGGGFYTPGYGMQNTVYKTDEVRTFLMNFYDGIVRPYSQDEAEKLISRDAELYAEYKALKSKQRKEQVSRYIRKYNERNPVYFLK
jgi:hypothetical protein